MLGIGMQGRAEEPLDFSSVCRVCCGRSPSSLPLFRVGLHRKVMACAAVQVWQNDGLPGQICKKCAAKLHISFQFKRQCEKSDIRLRHFRDTGKYVESEKNKNSNIDNMPVRREKKPPPEKPAEIPQPSLEQVFSEECDFTSCSLPGLVDRHFDSIITDVEDIRLESQQSFTGSDMLISVSDVIDLPLRDQFDITDSFNSNHIGSLTLDSNFDPQIQSPSVGDEILNLDNISVSSQLHTILIKDDEPSFLPHCDLNEININELSEEKDIKPSTSEGKNIKMLNDSENSEILHCPICNKISTSTSKLTRHMRTHSDEILYRCDICNKGFIHGGNFKVHLRMHSDERPFSCNICHKSCRQQQDLDKHMRTHTGERPHVCSICQRAFTTSSNLVAHERIHRGEKPYICSVCQKAFCQSNELTKHVRTHTGEKSHICPVCDKGFNGSSTLVVHMRIHTGERPYVCTVCNKGFTQSSCLAVHSRKHTAALGYTCDRCPRSFNSPRELRIHKEAHAPTNYPCEEEGCVRLFSRPNDLLRHTKLYHSKQNA